MMRFSSIKHLNYLKEDGRLSTVLSTLSCLSVNAQTTEVEDISMLVDIIDNVRVKNKYLVIQTPPLNITLLRSKRINFNVMINQIFSGKQ